MTVLRGFILFLFIVLASLPAQAQFISVGAGGVFSQDLTATTAGGRLGVDRTDWSRSSIVTADAGIGFLPLLSGSVHYSYARPDLFIRRGDAFGSSASAEAGMHTITLDGRFRSPEAAGFRVVGFLGGGISRAHLSIRNIVEVPFPGGRGDTEVFPVFTFGGGIEKRVAPLVRLKAEIRDYLSPIPSRFFLPGGAWHRVAVTGGITIGR